MEKGRQLLGEEPPFCKKQTRLRAMIVYFVGSLKEILQKGRAYVWPRVEECVRCAGRKVWGHGYVGVWFEGYNEAIEIRRYRCAECGCVIRMRPEGYYPRFQSLRETIRKRMEERIRTGRWPPGMSRQRQGHWMRGLVRKVAAYLGNRWEGDLMRGFAELERMGIIPVGRVV